MNESTEQTPIYKMVLTGNLLEVSFTYPVVWTEALARKGFERRLALAKGHKLLLLVDGRNVKEVTSEARKFLASQAEEGLLAVALWIKSPVERMIANIYLSWNKPRNPTCCFNSRDKAIAWLQRQEQLAQNSMNKERVLRAN